MGKQHSIQPRLQFIRFDRILLAGYLYPGLYLAHRDHGHEQLLSRHPLYPIEYGLMWPGTPQLGHTLVSNRNTTLVHDLVGPSAIPPARRHKVFRPRLRTQEQLLQVRPRRML